MAVSTTSHLSVDIAANESSYCDNVHSAVTCTMKQKLIIVHIRMIGAVIILSCCSMALQIWPLWYHWAITAIPILLSYPYVCYPWILFRQPRIKIYEMHGYVFTTHVTAVTTYDRIITYPWHYKMAWAMRWGHEQVIACTIPQRMIWQKYFFWTMLIKYPYVLYQRTLAWFYHRYGFYWKFLNLIVIEIFHFVALTIYYST